MDETRQKIEYILNFTRLVDMDSASNEIDMLKTSIIESVLQARTKCDGIIDNIQRHEPLEIAPQDIEKLKRAVGSVTIKFESLQTNLSGIEERRQLCCGFKENIENFESNLHELNEQLKNLGNIIGDNLTVSKTALATCQQFERNMMVS